MSRHTLSQNFSESLHKHRTCHDWRACNGICPAFVYIHLAQKPDISRCIRSNRVRLGLVAEIQNIFGTVHKGVPQCSNGNTLLWNSIYLFFLSRNTLSWQICLKFRKNNKIFAKLQFEVATFLRKSSVHFTKILQNFCEIMKRKMLLPPYFWLTWKPDCIPVSSL